MLDKIVVLNPVAEMPSAAQRINPAPRPSTLDGKRIGLYWNFKPGGDYVLEWVGEELKKRFTGARVKLFPSPRPVPENILNAVKSECDVVVGATAD
jgi:hypothetical protein